MTDQLSEPVSDLGMGTVARRSMWLSVGSLVGSALAVLTSFVLARWLGPSRFGRVQGVLLVYFYVALVRTGAFESALRRYIRLRALGRDDEARRARDVGTTVDFVFSLVPALGLVVWGLASDGGLWQRGLLLAPLVVMTTTAGAYLGELRAADHRFDLVAVSGVVRSLSYAALALGGVALFGDTALFVAPALADLLAVAVLASQRPRIGLRPRFDLPVAKDLVRSGLALGALPAVYWMYRLAGSTSVALGTDVVTFGLFSFAAAPVAVLLRAISQVDAVLTPAIWGEIARDEGDRRWLPAADRVTTTLFVVAGFATNLSQAGFGPVVLRFLPDYADAVPLFEVLAFNVVLLSVGVVPSLVLRDEEHGSQNRYLLLWVGALVVNVAANAVALAAGFGATTVAWNDVWVQAVVVIALFAMAAQRLDVPGWGRRAAIGFPVAAATVATVFGLRLLDGLAVRCVLVLGVWVSILFLVRHRLRPSEEMGRSTHVGALVAD